MSAKLFYFNRWPFILFFAGTFFVSTNTFAQQEYTLDSIVIQNRRIQIPFSEQNRAITILSQKIIESMPVQSVEELLSYVAGLDIRRRGVMGSQADISLNGGTFEQTLILLNGVKIIDPQTGHNMMNLPINLDAIERIEIIKGAAASVYGINAINGAINIVTRQPDKTGVNIHAYTGTSFEKDTLNNNLYVGYGLNVNASIASENSRHYLALTTVQSNGYRHNTAIDNKKIFYSNAFAFGRNKLKMMSGYVTNEFGANGFYAAPVDKESIETLKTVIASVQGKIWISDNWAFKPGVSYRYGSDHYVLNQHKPEVYQNRHYTNVFDINLNNSFYTQIGTFGLGMEFRRGTIASNSLGEHERNNLGFFGNYNYDAIPNTSINIGLYANYNESFGWELMPSIDLGYTLSDALRLYANAGTGMRIPSFTDLYYVGAVNVGNENLKPENAWQTSIGLKYHKKRFRASAEYFYRNTDDFIDWVKDELTDPWQSRNYYRVKMQGLSLSGDYRIFETPSSGYGLLAGLSYTYLSPEVKKTNSDLLSHYALENLKHQLTGRLNMTFLGRFSVTLSGKYQKRISSEDYFLLAARLGATFNDFQVYIGGSNLTNIRYIEAGAVPMPGRWLSLGVKWQWWKN